MKESNSNYRNNFFLIAIIVSLVILSFARMMFIQNSFWDDDCWILSVYASGNLTEYLSYGWEQLRRIPQGIFLYYLFGLHKYSNFPYLVWHSINICIMILSPVFLYFLLNGLFKNNRILAFLVAAAFIVSPLDQTVPVYSNIYYRLGIMLTILSLYLTKKALAQGIKWEFLLSALFISFVCQYTLIESAVAIEPARLFLIWYIFLSRGFAFKTSFKKAIVFWIPFVLLCIPLAIYKLIYKPYGVYAFTYLKTFSSILDWRIYLQVIKYLLFQTWYVFMRYRLPASLETISLGCLAIILSLFLFRNFPSSFKGRIEEDKNIFGILLVWGCAFLLFPLLMYLYVGNVVGTGTNSRHGAILQIGHAVLVGNVIYFIFRIFCSSVLRLRIFIFLLACFLGIGVFMHNLNLDLYFKGWEQKKLFWKKFTEKFPSLPERADFFMDIQDVTPFLDARLEHLKYLYVDLYHSYSLEFPLNLLYANSSSPDEFRRYRVYTIEDALNQKIFQNRGIVKFQKRSLWGEDIFEPQELIFIYYRNGELLVNGEISEKKYGAPYHMWLKKDFPILPAPQPYPLRHKLWGFK